MVMMLEGMSHMVNFSVGRDDATRFSNVSVEMLDFIEQMILIRESVGSMPSETANRWREMLVSLILHSSDVGYDLRAAVMASREDRLSYYRGEISRYTK